MIDILKNIQIKYILHQKEHRQQEPKIAAKNDRQFNIIELNQMHPNCLNKVKGNNDQITITFLPIKWMSNHRIKFNSPKRMKMRQKIKFKIKILW